MQSLHLVFKYGRLSSLLFPRSTAAATVRPHLLLGFPARGRGGLYVPSRSTASFIGELLNFPAHSPSASLPRKVVQPPVPPKPSIDERWNQCVPRAWHCLSIPLVQVFSVSVHTLFDDGMETPSDIHGSIRAIEEQGLVVNLYDRDIAHPETILKDGNLSLTGTEGSFILCCAHSATTLDVHLKDRARDVEVVKGQYVLSSDDQEFEDSCDKLKKAVVQGQHGIVSMYYTIFRFGVVANVTIEISKMHDTTRPFTHLYGSIVAGYTNAEKYCNINDETQLMKTSLFHKPSGQSVQAMLGTPVKLSRYVVAVPAYSSLRVEAQLWDSHGQFAGGSLEFPAHDRGNYAKLIDGEGGSISVGVRWQDAYSHLYEEDGFLSDSDEEADQEASGKEISSHKGQDAQRSPQILYGQQLGPAFTPSRSTYSLVSTSRNLGTDMLEVFSVFVDGITSDISAICGSIAVAFAPRLNIYEKDLSNLEILSPRKSLASVEGHFALDKSNFCMTLYLKDPVQDLVISDGSMSWSDPTLSSRSLYNERLCSVIQGPHGYAAVYYTIFDSACRATVAISVFFSDPGADPANIYGCVFGRYGDYDYSSGYEKKYYRSRLFDVPQTVPVQLTTHSRIPLSKSVMAVPIDSSLIVEADLRVMSNGNDEVVNGSVEVEVDLINKVRKEFRQGHCRIEVAVEFTSMK